MVLLTPQLAIAQVAADGSQQAARPTEGAAAQPAAERPGGVAIEDIIVTARRTSESSQKVPVSVIAFGNEQIEQRQIRSPIDLQSTVSGLTVRQTEHQNQLSPTFRRRA